MTMTLTDRLAEFGDLITDLQATYPWPSVDEVRELASQLQDLTREMLAKAESGVNDDGEPEIDETYMTLALTGTVLLMQLHDIFGKKA